MTLSAELKDSTKKFLPLLYGIAIGFALTTGFLTGSPWKTGLLLVCVSAFALFVSHPLWGLYLLLSTLTFDQFYLFETVTFPKFLGILVFSAWMVSLIIRKKNPLHQLSKTDFLIVSYLTICLISIGLRTEQKIASNFLVYAELLLAYVFIVSEVESRENLMTSLWMLVVPAALSGLVYIALFFETGGAESEYIRRLFAPTLAGINIASTEYLVFLGISLSLLAAYHNHRAAKNILISTIIIFLTYIYLSFSRGTWGGLSLMALCFLFFWSSRSRKNAYSIIPLSTGLIIFSALTLVFLQLSDELKTNFVQRVNFFALVQSQNAHLYLQKIALLNIIPENKWIGLGIGNVDNSWKTYALETEGIPAKIFQQYPKGTDAHSTFLNIAVEHGIPIFLIFTAIVSITLIQLKRGWNSAEFKEQASESFFLKLNFTTVLSFLAAAYWVPMENSLILFVLLGFTNVGIRLLT